MNEEKNYKEPKTQAEIINAQRRIAKWAAIKYLELEVKLQGMNGEPAVKNMDDMINQIEAILNVLGKK